MIRETEQFFYETQYKSIDRRDPPAAPVLPASGGASEKGRDPPLLRGAGHTIVVVGAGNLGKALMGNFKFSHIGFRLAAAFDVNEKTIGTTIAGTPVYHEDQLEFFIREHHVDVGLLTVPRTVAQVTAEKLVNAGVKGIWNFTNQELLLPGHEDVIVESVHFSESLLALSYMISQKEDEEKGVQQ